MNWKANIAFRETIGWCPQDKAEYLCQLVQEHRPKIILEIGVYAGKSLFPMAITAQRSDCRVIGIEPFALAPTQEGINPKSNDEWWGNVDYENLEQRVKNSLERWKLNDTVEIIKKTSKEALPDMPHDIDIIHQDSNHAEAVSFWETKHYAPLLAKGGFYVLDDLDWNVDGKLTNEKSIALLDKLFKRVHWVGEGPDQWGVWQNV